MATATALLAAIGLATLAYVFLTLSRWRSDASTPGSAIVVAGLAMCLLALLLSIVSGVLAWAPSQAPTPALNREEADRG